jgi:hypothetical protein
MEISKVHFPVQARTITLDDKGLLDGVRTKIEGPDCLKLLKVRLQELLLQEWTAPKIVEISALFKLLHASEKMRFKDVILIPIAKSLS